MTETQPNCPNCGKPLAAVALQGLCPECLIQAGWPTEDGPQGDAQTSGPPFVPPTLEEIKELFPQLEILELIGKGGMGAVYKARQPDLDRLVALKILAPRHQHDPGFAERFTREARALARLSHPHIVNVYDFGHKGDLSYFVMEFVDGPNLREVERAGQLSAQEALAIVPQICTALQFAHDEGVVHRDIKPENILLDRKGRVKIADFGLAKIMGRDPRHLTLTQEGHVMGTPHYMAPEQVEHPHEVDHRADIYSLGVVFYELLTGELPLGKFQRPSQKVHIDVRLDEVVLKTLEKEPALRYQQVNQVGTEVETIASGVCVTKDSQGRSEESVAEIERSLRIPAIGLFVSGCLNIAVCLVAALSVLVVVFLPGIIEIALVLVVACLALVVLKGATCMRRRENYRLSVVSAFLAIMLSLGTFVGMLFGGWALILLTRREVRSAFQAKQGHEHTPPDWQWAGRLALWTTAVHAIPLFLVGVFLVVVVPKYLALYSNMAMPIPTFSRAAFVLAGFLNAYGLFVLLALLISDAIVLWPLCAYGGRRACRWWSVVVMGVLVFVVGGTVAGIRLPLQQIQMNRDPRPGAVNPQATYPFMAHLPQGTVELLGVCEHPSVGRRWWAPDGSPVLDNPAIVNSSTAHPGKNERAREFLVRTAGLPDHASGLVLHVKDAGSSSGYTVEDVNGRHLPDLVATSVILPDDLETTDLKVGVALDPWETIVTRDGRGSGIETTYANGRNWGVSVMEAVEIQGDTRITVAHTVGREWDVRLVARTDSGEVSANGTDSQSTEGMSHVTFTYSGLSLEAIKRFSFQVRPYIWATFENVSVVSGQKTAVQIRCTRDPLSRPAPAQEVVAVPEVQSVAAVLPATASPWVASLPQGNLELLAVSGVASDAAAWWKPDGSSWTGGRFQVSPDLRFRQGGIPQGGSIQVRVRRFALRAHGLPEDADWSRYRLDVDYESAVLYARVLDEEGHEDPNLKVLELAVPQDIVTADVEIAAAMGAWMPRDVLPTDDVNLRSIVLNNEPLLSFGPGSKAGVKGSLSYDRGKAWVRLTHGPLDHQVRVLAFDRDGVAHRKTNTMVETRGRVSQFVYLFENLSNRDVASFELQSRPYHWASFKNVALQPDTRIAKPATRTLGPVDFEGTFPFSEVGAEALERLWQDPHKDTCSADEILAVARDGLRRYQGNGNILRWIGNLFIWGKDPQNEKAIELMYHASGSPDRNLYGDAIYFGLSVAQEKTPEILQAMAAVAMKTDDYYNVTGRILWGCRDQKEALTACLDSYLNVGDPAVRAKAQDVKSYFLDSKAFMSKRAEEHQAAVQQEFGPGLVKFKEDLIRGDSQKRLDVLERMQQEGVMSIADDSFIVVLGVCLDDADPRVRRRAAQMMGSRFLWKQGPQNPAAIMILTRRLDDTDRETRTTAVYYGLSVVHQPSRTLVEKLLLTILDDREINYYGRVIGGVRRNMQASRDTLQAWMDQHATHSHRAVKAYEIYEDVTGERLPETYAARFSGQVSDVHEGLVAMCIPVEKMNRERLREVVVTRLSGARLLELVNELYIRESRDGAVALFVCRTLADRNAIRAVFIRDGVFQVAGYTHGRIGPTGSGWLQSRAQFRQGNEAYRIVVPAASRPVTTEPASGD